MYTYGDEDMEVNTATRQQYLPAPTLCKPRAHGDWVTQHHYVKHFLVQL